MTLAFFIDESGLDDKTGATEHHCAGVAGFLAEPEAWAKFSGEWDAVLREYNISEFHFSEFADRKRGPSKAGWPYRGWDDSKRKEFLMQLAVIAGRHKRLGIGAYFDVRDYSELIPLWFRKRSAHPHDLCLKLLFETLLFKIEKLLPDPKTNVMFIFDQTTDAAWKHSVRMMHAFIKNNGDIHNRMRKVSPVFADSIEMPPIQAADMLAYRLRQRGERWLQGNPDKESELDAVLEQNPGEIILSLYKRDSLKGLAATLEGQRPMIEELYRQEEEVQRARREQQDRIE